MNGEGDGTPLQYPCLENPMDGGAWKAAVHGVAKSRTRLSDFTFPFHFHALEKEMLTHSSVLAWRIPGTGEPVGLPSMGLQSWTRLKRLSSSSSRKISMRQTHVGAWKRRKKSGHMMNFWKTFQGKTVKWYMDMKKCLKLKRLERIKQTKRNDWNYMEEY